MNGGQQEPPFKKKKEWLNGGSLTVGEGESSGGTKGKLEKIGLGYFYSISKQLRFKIKKFRASLI